ncbi:MAG: iron ABC transporter ATP-binding protein [marine bacterium B5-7]|nr:MAG: iron ABC transporter ATP-binding protein [marine bacterium B5-7]
MNPLLKVEGITCEYDDQVAVRNLGLEVEAGSLVCLLGPSGCGKTTVLRAIAGFHALSRGEIHIDGTLVSSTRFTLAPEQRHVGMVFQEHALFPHMNASENIAAGIRKLPADERYQRIEEMLEKVGLSGFADRYPHEMSGGQQQRIALARALAPGPHLLLMDEPFSSLDLELREKLGIEVHDLLKREGITSVLVTHDQMDAFALADFVGVMHAGEIVQWDTPYNLYHEPRTRFVADFVGDGVFVDGLIRDRHSIETELGIVEDSAIENFLNDAEVDVLLRPDDIVPCESPRVRARIVRKAFKGAEILYTLRLASGTRVLSLFPSHADHAVGEEVGVCLDAEHLVVFPK